MWAKGIGVLWFECLNVMSLNPERKSNDHASDTHKSSTKRVFCSQRAAPFISERLNQDTGAIASNGELQTEEAGRQIILHGKERAPGARVCKVRAVFCTRVTSTATRPFLGHARRVRARLQRHEALEGWRGCLIR
jgi:hypothetical protein